MIGPYFWLITRRLTFCVGVSSPVSRVNSLGSSSQATIFSKPARLALTASTSWPISSLHLRIGDQLLVAPPWRSLLLRPRLERLEVGHQQRREELPAVADHHRLADVAARLERVLDRRRRHVLAVGVDDQLLLAVGDAQEALGVDLADVAGVEPPLGVDHLRGLLLLVPVALHDVGPLGEDLAVVGDLDLRRPAMARPTVPSLTCSRAVDGDHRRGLREAVALVDRDAGAPEELGDVARQRRAAGDGEVEASAEPRLDLREHQLVGEAELAARGSPAGSGASAGRGAPARPTPTAQAKSFCLIGELAATFSCTLASTFS